MADWVHCNACFRQPGDGKRFSLTNCGHIYCENCAKPGCQMVCKMCQSNCTTILLSSKMKPDVETFFTDPIDLEKKHHKQMIQVMEFQRNHRKRLTAFIQERMLKQASLVSKSQKSVQVIQEYEKEIKSLKEENLYLKKMMKSGGRTPPPGMARPSSGGSPVANSRMLSPSPTRNADLSPRQYGGMSVKRSPHANSFQQMAKPPYDMPLVTTGRVLVKTPPLVTSGRVLVKTPSPMASKMLPNPSPYARYAASSHVGVNVPAVPNIAMPITPLVSTVHSCKSPIASPMEMGKSNQSPRIGYSGSGYGGHSQSNKPNYPSRLR